MHCHKRLHMVDKNIQAWLKSKQCIMPCDRTAVSVKAINAMPLQLHEIPQRHRESVMACTPMSETALSLACSNRRCAFLFGLQLIAQIVWVSCWVYCKVDWPPGPPVSATPLKSCADKQAHEAARKLLRGTGACFEPEAHLIYR